MLLEKSGKHLLIRLITGQDIISFVKQENDNLVLIWPMVIETQLTKDNDLITVLRPYSMYTTDVTINAEKILSESPPDIELVKMYKQLVAAFKIRNEEVLENNTHEEALLKHHQDSTPSNTNIIPFIHPSHSTKQ